VLDEELADVNYHGPVVPRPRVELHVVLVVELLLKRRVVEVLSVIDYHYVRDPWGHADNY